MASCSNHMSRVTRKRCWHRRWKPDSATGQGQTGEGSKHRSKGPRTELNASKSATRQPRTRRGGHSQIISPLPHHTPRSQSGNRGAAPPFPLPPFPHQSGRARQQPTPHPPPPAWYWQRVGRPQQRRRHHQKQDPHPRGTGGPRASPARGGGRVGGTQPALGEPPSHGRCQATGASWVSRALHPQQAQAGSRGRGGQHGKQGASPRTSPPSRSTRPLRFGLHHGGYCDIAKG